MADIYRPPLFWFLSRYQTQPVWLHHYVTGLWFLRQFQKPKVTSGFDEASSEVERLQQQNDNLRAVISQMREEMETLGSQFPGSNQSAREKQDSVTAG